MATGRARVARPPSATTEPVAAIGDSRWLPVQLQGVRDQLGRVFGQCRQPHGLPAAEFRKSSHVFEGHEAPNEESRTKFSKLRDCRRSVISLCGSSFGGNGASCITSPLGRQGHTAPAMPTPYKPCSHRLGAILCYIWVIMFLCTSRLPSFALRARERRASANQNTAGQQPVFGTPPT